MYAVVYHERWSGKRFAGKVPTLAELAQFLHNEAALEEYPPQQIERTLQKLIGSAPSLLTTELDDNGGLVHIIPPESKAGIVRQPDRERAIQLRRLMARPEQRQKALAQKQVLGLLARAGLPIVAWDLSPSLDDVDRPIIFLSAPEANG